MKKCENCGAMIPDEAMFCPECGAQNMKNKIEKKSKKKSWIIILCLICFVAGTVFAVNKFMMSNNDQNGIKNNRTVLYNHYIYYLKNGILYKQDADVKSASRVMKLPCEIKGNNVDICRNLKVYKDRLYAVREERNDKKSGVYIFSINLDGTEYKKEIVPPKFRDEDGTSYQGYLDQFSIENDTIYYTYSDYPVAYYHIYKHEIGDSKSVDTKQEIEETPVLFGKYVYYMKDDNKKSEVIKRDLETEEETEELTVQELNEKGYSLGVGKEKIAFSTDSSIIWKNSKKDDNYNIKNVGLTTALTYITNMSNEEVIYNSDDIYYKLNIKKNTSQKLFSEKLMKKDFNASIGGIDQVGDDLVIYGCFDDEDEKGFLFFIEEEEGKDYENAIWKMLARYRDD